MTADGRHARPFAHWGLHMSFSEARMSRDYGIDFGGYDNDGSSTGTTGVGFLEDRIDAMRFESAVPGSGEPWYVRAATFGIPALADAAARREEARARVQIAQANNVGATFGGYNGRTNVVPQPGAPLTGPMAVGGMGSGTLLLLAAVGVAVFMLAKD